MTTRYQRFSDFWPHYLREHAKAQTRALHYVGTGLTFVAAAFAIAVGDARLLLMMPVAGYFFAWLAHFAVERNKPATFTYPLWSLVADYRMFFLALSGRLKAHLRAAGVAVTESADRSATG